MAGKVAPEANATGRLQAVAVLVISALLLPGCAEPEQARPNILLIVAAGLGWSEPSDAGGEIKTPAIDSMVTGGLSLDRFYVSPLGSPTRAGLMTGRHPIRLGLTYSDVHAWDNAGVHPGEHFLPQSFQAAGYQTAYIGAWGLGHAQQTYHPNERGLDNFWGQLLPGSALHAPYANMGGADLQHNGAALDAEGAYLPTWIGDKASEVIRSRNVEQPLLLMLSFAAARSGSEPPTALPARCRGLESPSAQDARMQRDCAAFITSIETMDASIDRVLKTLAAEGMTDDTLVLFMSDSGSAFAVTEQLHEQDRRGGRGQVRQGGIHAPALLFWPGRLEAGGRFGEIATMMDIFPTLASAAGVQTANERKLDGLNLWPALSQGRGLSRNTPVVFAAEAEQYGHFQLIAVDRDWKLVQTIEVGLLDIRVHNHLYRNSEGFAEKTNLASQFPGEVRRLEAAIKAMRRQHPINGLRNTMVPPPGWRGPDNWAEYPIALAALQNVTAAGSPPPFARRPLDFQLGEKGRLIYDCEIRWWSFGICIRNQDEDIAVYDFHNKD